MLKCGTNNKFVENRAPVTRRPDPSLLLLAAATVAVVLISIPGLGGPLVLDSTKLQGLDDLVARYGNRAVLHTTGFHGELQRIVTMATFVLNAQLGGGLSAYQLKLTNIAIHASTGILVYGLCRLLLGRAWHSRHAAGISVGAAALWMLAPVNLDVALYTVQRMAQLSTFFTLAGLVLYAAGRLEERPARGALYLGLAVLVCLPLAVLSKENGILLLPLALLVEVYFLHPVRPWMSGRQLALITVLGAAIAAGLVLHFYPNIASYRNREFTLAERLLSEPRALMSYLRHILLPYGADTGVYGDDFAVSKSLFSPLSTLSSLLGLLAMAVFCVTCGRGRLKPLAFGAAFFLVAHVVESSFIPLEPYFLHRNYLPSYGIYLALACLPFLALSGRPRAGRWPVILLVICSVYFGVVSLASSLTWSTRENIVAAAVHYHPKSPRALSDYAQLATGRGDFKPAIAALDKAITLRDSVPAHIQRIYVLCRAGAPVSQPEYRGLESSRTFGVHNEVAQALDNVLTLYRGGGCPQLEVEPLVRSLDELAARYAATGRNPWTIEYYADTFLYFAGERAAALQRLERRLESGHLESGLYRVELLIDAGDKSRAEQTLHRIQDRFPARRLDRYAQTLADFRRRLARM